LFFCSFFFFFSLSRLLLFCCSGLRLFFALPSLSFPRCFDRQQTSHLSKDSQAVQFDGGGTPPTQQGKRMTGNVCKPRGTEIRVQTERHNRLTPTPRLNQKFKSRFSGITHLRPE